MWRVEVVALNKNRAGYRGFPDGFGLIE